MAGRNRLPMLLLRLVLSLSILAFILIRQTSLGEIGEVLRTVDWRWLALAFSLHAFGLFSSAYRWQILARAQGDDIPLGFLAKSYLVGQFFNNFLPTRFGGDIVRIWDGSRYSKSLVEVLGHRPRRAVHRDHRPLPDGRRGAPSSGSKWPARSRSSWRPSCWACWASP